MNIYFNAVDDQSIESIVIAMYIIFSIIIVYNDFFVAKKKYHSFYLDSIR